MRKLCPNCQTSNGLRQVIYGMPDGPMDESKYEVGGCCLSEKDPMSICVTCGWEGDFTNHVQFPGLADFRN